MSRTACCDAKVECPCCEGGQEAASLAEVDSLRAKVYALESSLRERDELLGMERERTTTILRWLMSVKKLDPRVEGLDAATLLAAAVLEVPRGL